MAEARVESLNAQVQAYLNCLELCKALQKQTDSPDLRQALAALLDDLQESLATLASHLRQRGTAPGTIQLDSQGKARVQKMLRTRSLAEQMYAIRDSLADVAAWYVEHPAPDQTDSSIRDLLLSLSAHARRMLEEWDQFLREMKAV